MVTGYLLQFWLNAKLQEVSLIQYDPVLRVMPGRRVGIWRKWLGMQQINAEGYFFSGPKPREQKWVERWVKVGQALWGFVEICDVILLIGNQSLLTWIVAC